MRIIGIFLFSICLAAACLSAAGAESAPPSACSIDTGLPVVPEGVVSRAITWENKTGEPGKGGMAGGGRKGSPCIRDVEPGATVTLMDVEGCGVIRHIWVTVREQNPEGLRNMILRMYWDGNDVPSVEVPMGDFFGVAHGFQTELSSYYVTRPGAKAFNCYFPMPFATHAKITVTNDRPEPIGAFFFQIDYELRDSLPPNTCRFHAQFRRQNPTTLGQDFVVLDNVKGPGFFLGCVIGIRPLGPSWWGEGEMKFYMDGDTEFPTICGTGTEDYFGTGWGMRPYQTPFMGCPLYKTDKQFTHGLVSLYRWHVLDPVYFRESFKATIQQLGWDRGIAERQDDWSSVAYWYQLEPNYFMPPFPNREERLANLLEPPKEEEPAPEPEPEPEPEKKKKWWKFW